MEIILIEDDKLEFVFLLQTNSSLSEIEEGICIHSNFKVLIVKRVLVFSFMSCYICISCSAYHGYITGFSSWALSLPGSRENTENIFICLLQEFRLCAGKNVKPFGVYFLCVGWQPVRSTSRKKIACFIPLHITKVINYPVYLFILFTQ